MTWRSASAASATSWSTPWPTSRTCCGRGPRSRTTSAWLHLRVGGAGAEMVWHYTTYYNIIQHTFYTHATQKQNINIYKWQEHRSGYRWFVVSDQSTGIPSIFLNFWPCPWPWYATKWIIYQQESESGFGQIAEFGFLEIWPIFQVK